MQRLRNEFQSIIWDWEAELANLTDPGQQAILHKDIDTLRNIITLSESIGKERSEKLFLKLLEGGGGGANTQ
jgi:hypothetical protein